MAKTVLAFDFGASTGRAIKATFDAGRLDYHEIHRFDNTPIEYDGKVCHDVDMILAEVKTAIEKAGKVDSLAFDTWGVDYGLIGTDGKLICPPFHYRDERTADILKTALRKLDADTLYRETGNQIMNINTLFQLLCEKELGKAETVLFMPDLFGYLLTGNKACELSIASTSQMLNPVSSDWSETVLDTYNIDKSLFAPLVSSGTVLGEYNGIKVVSVCGHDTQCAVCAMPTASRNAAFLSCGTWSLLGCETEQPVLTAESRKSELSNELSGKGKVNYLKNISGLWLIQETKRDYKKHGEDYSYNDLEMMARDSEPFFCFIDPDAPSLSAHGELPEKIRAYCKKTGQPVPGSAGQLVRCIYESLALKYRLALEQISGSTGKRFDVLHLLGGGTKDGFLCEMTAKSLGIPVVAGPVEATALGNIMLQLIALGEVRDIEEARAIIAGTQETKKYAFDRTAEWDKAYEKYKSILQNNKEE